MRDPIGHRLQSALVHLACVAVGLFVFLLAQLWPSVPSGRFAWQSILAAVAGLLCVSVVARLVIVRSHRRYLAQLRQRVDACHDDLAAFDVTNLPETEGDAEGLLASLATLTQGFQHAVHKLIRTTEELEQHKAGIDWVAGSEKQAESFRAHTFPYERSRQQMIARLTPNLQWQSVTPLLQQVMGRSVDDLLGRSFLQFVDPTSAARVEKALRESFREGECHNVVFLALPRRRNPIKEGEATDATKGLLYLQMSVLAYFDPDGQPLQLRCHFVDVSDRVLAEQALRRRTDELVQVNQRLRTMNRDLERLKESYRDLYHHAPVMYFSVDRQGRMAAFNESLLRALGYERRELQSRPYEMLLADAEKEAYRQDPTALQRAGEIETQWVMKDGTVIDVWIGNNVILDDDHDGVFHRSRSAARDVTERNQMERALEERAYALHGANLQLRRINQELEDFTYVVSHDLKEPLRTIEAFSNFLALDCGPQLPDIGREHLQHVTAASQRLGRLIDDLLKLSRAGRVIGVARKVRLDDLLGTVMSDLQNLQDRSPNVTIRADGALPAVEGDAERLHQLLVNLVANAIKYNESSEPEVVIGCCDASNGADGFATFFVRDNGIGIEPQYHDKIFGIFQRLHHREQYTGTGAGLAICKKIVEAHEGRIWVESEPGRGSTFYFTLPRSPGSFRSLESSHARLAALVAGR